MTGRIRNILLAVFFAALAVAAYRSILNDYPVADDFGHIAKLSGLHAYDVWKFFTVQSQYFIRPLPFFAIWAEYRVFGLDWFPDHLLNVVMHGLNGFLLFYLLYRLGAGRLAAFAAGALAVLSPLAPEAVTWTAGRFDVWALFFVLISLLAYAIFLENRRRAAYVLALAAAAAALLSKESAVILAILIPAMDLIFGNTPNESPQKSAFKARAALLRFGVRMLPFLLLFSAYGALRLAISGALARTPGYMSLSGSAGFNLRAPARTLATLAAPLDRLVTSRPEIVVFGMYCGALFAVSLVLVVFRWKRAATPARRSWIFMLIFFGASLLPTYSSFFSSGMSNYLNNSRFFYCTIFAMTSLLVIGLVDFGWKARAWLYGLGAALAVMALAYSWGLASNNTVWEKASSISYYINDETKTLLPDPPRGANLYFEGVPRLEGGHIYASALDTAIPLSYQRDDLKVFYTDPDPVLASLYPATSYSGDGYLFRYDWSTGELQLVSQPQPASAASR